mmetsp:Transcript_6723/g.9191  ORF Transcript_6723/g.9191 Transcript_6723/m.9191 type:complete len:108 (-) Transcript_6723:291-614(-)
MIVPIYGHRAKMVSDGEGGVYESPQKLPAEAKRKPIAIIQFVNKLDFKQIDNYDLEKIKAMKDLLGLSIENASEHHAVINVKVGVQENLSELKDIVLRTAAQCEDSA